MNPSSQTAFRCAVCSAKTSDHSTWFLVIENSWMDRIKVLAWHPLLADQSESYAVCGKAHLEVLVTHWLDCGNLNFAPLRGSQPAQATVNTPQPPPSLPSAGAFIGELAVHRESGSQFWPGSVSERQAIVQALVSGLGLTTTSDYIPPHQPMEIRESLPLVLPEYTGERVSTYALL